MEIVYRLLDASSEAEIIQWLDLYRICFQGTLSREYWHWIHVENPFYKKTKPLVFIAMLDERIIGSVSLIPSQIQTHLPQSQGFLHSCLVYAAMVHPEYRRQGVFSSLLKNAMNLAKNEDYDVLIASTSNIRGYKRFMYAGFDDVAYITSSKAYLSLDGVCNYYIPVLPRHMRNLLGYPVTRIFMQLFPKISHTFHVRYGDAAEFIGDINKMHELNPSKSGMHGVRSLPFMRWRYSSPGLHYKCVTLWEGEMLVAYLILDYRCMRNYALIEDLFARQDDENLMLILVSEVLAILKKDTIESMWMYLIGKNNNLSRIFSLKNGFIFHLSGSKTLPMARFLWYPLKVNVYTESFSDKNPWNLLPADFEFD